LLLALFMVLVVPSCWFGTLERANGNSALIPPNGNEEEREEHDASAEHRVVRRIAPPPGRPSPSTIVDTQRAPVVRVASKLPDVGPTLHPSRFSVRRLR
jgi:hypothetical protein